MRLVSALNGFRGSLPSPLPIPIAPVRSELRERIKEGFEPSSLCSYYPLSSEITSPAHPTCLFWHSPQPLPISHAIIFLHPTATPCLLTYIYTSHCSSASPFSHHFFLNSLLKRVTSLQTFSLFFWSDLEGTLLGKKWNTALQKLFKDTVRKLLWHLCDIFCDTHTRSINWERGTAPTQTTGGTTEESPQVSVTDQRRQGHSIPSKMTEEREFLSACVCVC